MRDNQRPYASAAILLSACVALIAAGTTERGTGPAPLPTPTPTHAPTLQVPNVRLLAPSVSTYLVDQSVYPSSALASVLSQCGAPGAKWGTAAAANLRGGFSAEKAYLQERDRFGSPVEIGFVPETVYRVCLNFYITVGQFTGGNPTGDFVITARHRAGGPMYCVTNIGGALPAGSIGVSNSGGPIQNPNACAALPQFVPSVPFSPMAPRPFPLPTSTH